MPTTKKPAATRTRKVSSPAKKVAQVREPSVDPSNNAKPELLRKRELVDNVVRRSGVKKKDAKPVVEAMLAELGEALATGRELALPPLGRVVINREKELPDGRVIILKLRQKSRQTAPISTPLPDA